MSALNLNEKEREEFIRLWDEAGKPAAVRRATAGPPIPNVALWKHLPSELNKVSAEYPGLAPANPDYVLAEIVPAAGALLAWRALIREPPARRQLGDLRRLVSEAQPTSPTKPEPAGDHVIRQVTMSAEAIASSRLPHLWHSLLVASRETTRALTSGLKCWMYNTGMSSVSAAHLSFRFKQAAADERFGVDCVPGKTIVRVHDALVLDQLWTLIGLEGQPDFSCYVIHEASVELDGLLATDPKQFINELPQAADHMSAYQALELLVEWQRRTWQAKHVMFLQRLASRPRVAQGLIGDGWKPKLRRANKQASAIWRLIGETNRTARRTTAVHPRE